MRPVDSLIAPPKKPDRDRPPAHLSRESKAFWSRVIESYVLEEHHLRTLRTALEAWDRAQQARRALAEAGPVYTDRFGAPRKSPWVSIEENARIQYLRAVRELRLDDAPDDPRPPRVA
jgi:P27 family predicted phage terminase small subunit